MILQVGFEKEGFRKRTENLPETLANKPKPHLTRGFEGFELGFEKEGFRK